MISWQSLILSLPRNRSRNLSLSKVPKISKMKTLSHNNFGKKGGAKNHKLTASAYSSTVAMTISTKYHERHYDAVFAKPSDLKTYNNDDMGEDDRYMRRRQSSTLLISSLSLNA